MHSLNTMLHRRAGFSLVEILIAMTLTGILSVVGYQQITAITRNRAALNSQREANSLLLKLVGEVERNFRSRSDPPQFVPTLTFVSASATPCQGLQLTRQDPKLNAKVSTLYTTECVAYQVRDGADWVGLINADPTKYVLNRELNCGIHEVPRVVITETILTLPPTMRRRYIAEQPSPTFPASVICFRAKGPDIQVESGGMSSAGKDVNQAFQRRTFSTRDKSAGIEYLSP